LPAGVHRLRDLARQVALTHRASRSAGRSRAGAREPQCASRTCAAASRWAPRRSRAAGGGRRPFEHRLAVAGRLRHDGPGPELVGVTGPFPRTARALRQEGPRAPGGSRPDHPPRELVAEGHRLSVPPQRPRSEALLEGGVRDVPT
jgi:hypothetical protein